MRSTRAFKLLAAILIIVLTLASSGCNRQKVKKAAAVKPKAAVNQGVEAFGLVKAREHKDINLDFPAQILKVPVKDGQNVKLGEPLIYLNINDFKAMIGSKENELNQARYELLRLKKRLKDSEETYLKFRGQLADKESLFQKELISRQEVDDFKDVVKEKEKEITDIQLSLAQNSGITGIEVQAEKVRVLEYDLTRMRNKLNQSFLQGNIIISDYANAVVYEINCAAGYSVGVEEKQEKLLSIMDLDSLYVSADVAEEFIKDVRIGAAVTIIPVADNSRKYQGKVIRISDMAVKQNGETNVPVEISIVKPDRFLRPNFNVDVEIAK